MGWNYDIYDICKVNLDQYGAQCIYSMKQTLLVLGGDVDELNDGNNETFFIFLTNLTNLKSVSVIYSIFIEI